MVNFEVTENVVDDIDRLQRAYEIGGVIQALQKDQLDFLAYKIVSVVLNHEWVGIQSGNLRRSIQVYRDAPDRMVIDANEALAPYAKIVNKRLKAAGRMGGFNANFPPDGRTFYKIALDIYGEWVAQVGEKRWAEFVEAVVAGRKYTFTPLLR